MADQRGLVVVVETVPRHGDEVGAALDVQQAVIGVGQVVVVDPDVGRTVLDVDGVVARAAEAQVADDDVAGSVEVEAAAGDAAAGAHADDRLVGADLLHSGQRDGPVDLDDPAGVPGDVLAELGGVGGGHGGAARAAGGAAVHARIADGAALRRGGGDGAGGDLGLVRADGDGDACGDD
nr:hypothetical protein [Actinomadura rudentiformis]